MEKVHTYTCLDERDLAELIEAYSKRFYDIIEKFGAEGCYSDYEMHTIVKKLANFIREYEEIREKTKKAVQKPKVEAITREVKNA